MARSWRSTKRGRVRWWSSQRAMKLALDRHWQKNPDREYHGRWVVPQRGKVLADAGGHDDLQRRLNDLEADPDVPISVVRVPDA